MYGWFDLKPLFLGRLRPELLTSNQGGQSVANKRCLEAQAAHLFLQVPMGGGVSEKGDFENTVSNNCCLDSMGNCTWNTLFHYSFRLCCCIKCCSSIVILYFELESMDTFSNGRP